MIIVLKPTDNTTIAELKNHFEGTHDIFVHHNRVAVQGITRDDLNDVELAAADEIIEDVPALFKQSSIPPRRHGDPDGTQRDRWGPLHLDGGAMFR